MREGLLTWASTSSSFLPLINTGYGSADSFGSPHLNMLTFRMASGKMAANLKHTSTEVHTHYLPHGIFTKLYCFHGICLQITAAVTPSILLKGAIISFPGYYSADSKICGLDALRYAILSDANIFQRGLFSILVDIYISNLFFLGHLNMTLRKKK